MKHESNDTPPFAPDDPISRSLFVRPNLIELRTPVVRLAASDDALANLCTVNNDTRRIQMNKNRLLRIVIVGMDV